MDIRFLRRVNLQLNSFPSKYSNYLVDNSKNITCLFTPLMIELVK